MGVNKILKMVDLVGSVEKYNAFSSQVVKMLNGSINKNRYWLSFKKVGDELARNPKITNKKSILPILFNAAKFNLDPDPSMKQIWFIPYKGTLTYQIGYQGMVTLASRAGLAVRSNLVYDKDEWDYSENENGQHFIFRPNFNERLRGKEILAFSVFTRVDNGFNQIHVMDSAHIDNIKKLVLARMKDSSTPWNNPLFEPEMRKKTCIRRHAKTEPFSVDISTAIHHEEQNEIGNTIIDTHDELKGIIDQTDINDSDNSEIVQEMPEHLKEFAGQL